MDDAAFTAHQKLYEATGSVFLRYLWSQKRRTKMVTEAQSCTLAASRENRRDTSKTATYKEELVHQPRKRFHDHLQASSSPAS